MPYYAAVIGVIISLDTMPFLFYIFETHYEYRYTVDESSKTRKK